MNPMRAVTNGRVQFEFSRATEDAVRDLQMLQLKQATIRTIGGINVILKAVGKVPEMHRKTSRGLKRNPENFQDGFWRGEKKFR